jgi:hypothetical protein
MRFGQEVYNLQQFIEKAAGWDRRQKISFADRGFLYLTFKLDATRGG